MGLGKEIINLTGPGAIGNVYKKHRKSRAEDRANKKKLKHQEEIAESKEGTAHRLYKTGAKQQRHVIEGKDRVETDIKKLSQQYAQAGEGTEQFFQPIQQQAIRNFNQTTVPQLLTQYGQGSKSSSALNQALGAAAGHLHENIAANFAQMKQNQAGNIFAQSQAAQAQNIAYQSSAAQGALNQPSAYQPYMGGPSQTSGFWNKWAPIIGGIGGGVTMGPGGVVPGMQAGQATAQVLS